MSVEVETSAGPLNIYPINANLVRVDAGIPMNVDPWRPLTIRGVKYAAQAHLYRWSDGQFHCGREGDDIEARQSRWHDPNLSRQFTDRQTVSTSAQDKAREIIEQAVNEWAANAGSIVAEANVAYIESELERARARHTEKVNEALLIERQIEGLEADLETARADLENA